MTVIFRIIVAFVIGVGLVSCGGPAGPGDGGGGSGPEGVIVGTLADAGGAPLAGEQVALTLSAPTLAATLGTQGTAVKTAAVTTTNARGQFAFDVGQEGTYVLTNLGDTTGALARVVVTRGTDDRLASEGSVALTALELGAVTGKVAGKGAGVMAFLSGTSFLALTAPDGSFVIGRVPAGSYEALAGIAGAVGAAVPVTVTAGAAVALSEDLRLGPVVTGVTPAGLEPIDWDLPTWRLLAPTEFVIRGSGLGDRQGLSRLTYAGLVEVPVVAIRSWADDAIVIDTLGLGDPFGLTYDRAFRPEDLRFTLTTVAGEAVTPVSGAYTIAANRLDRIGSLIPVSFSFGVWPGWLVEGVQVAITVRNGVAQDMSGASITQLTSGGTGGWEAPPSFQVQPVGLLPTIVSLDPTLDPAVTRGDVYRMPVAGGVLELDAGTYVVGANVASGRLLASDGVTPMPDDGRFDMRVYASGAYLCSHDGDTLLDVPLTLASDGSWSVAINAPAGLPEDALCLGIMYDGVQFETQALYLVE